MYQTAQSMQVGSLKTNIHLNLSTTDVHIERKISDFIPCLLMKFETGSSKIFLYFHANAEDLGRAYKFLSFINVYLRMHVIAVEYPGYGVYEGDMPSAEKIINDADIVYNFIKDTLRWKESDIIVCGRSIGAGPACYLASTYRPSSLVLVSPHTSIRGIVKDQFLGRFT
jgi:pimeloyl-ACP methyl ester carboxylesterase